jgi:hypothetical protein
MCNVVRFLHFLENNKQPNKSQIMHEAMRKDFLQISVSQSNVVISVFLRCWKRQHFGVKGFLSRALGKAQKKHFYLP